MPVVVRPINDDEYQVLIDLTAVDSTTVVPIDLPMRKGRIMRHKARLISGSGKTIETLVARSATATTGVPVEFVATPIGTSTADKLIIDEQPNDPVLFFAADVDDPTQCLPTGTGRLYYRPQPNTGANNVIEAEFMIRRDWP